MNRKKGAAGAIRHVMGKFPREGLIRLRDRFRSDPDKVLLSGAVVDLVGEKL